MTDNLEIKGSQSIVLLCALLATFIPVLIIETYVLFSTGRFCYPLDDPFIHMEIASNLAHHGFWGINSNEFSSASSSLLYTLILAALSVFFSDGFLLPFIVNCMAAIILLIVVQRWLQKQNVNAGAQLLIFFLLIFFTPLPILIISGMEHTLQCLFSFLFIFNFSHWLQRQTDAEQEKGKLPSSLLVYGFLVTAIRYEGLFLIAIACLMLVYYKKAVLALQLGTIATIPVLVFGILSVANASFFFPNSVLVKSEAIPFSVKGVVQFLSNVFIDKLTLSKNGITSLATQRLLLILPLAYLVFIKYIRQNRFYGFVLIMLILATLFQLSFAATGWFYRYEAYLILCSTMVLSVLIYKSGYKAIVVKLKRAPLLIVAILFFFQFPLVLRSSAAFSKAAQASINIYEQQYQMGQFFKQYYPNTSIAANDVGAVSYFTNGYIVDLWGLGNNEVAKSRTRGYWTPVFLDSISRQKNAKIAVVYNSWFDSSLVQRWTKVATWQIQNNVICGDDRVSFYAIEDSSAPALKANLIQYQPMLPRTVAVRYF